MEFDKVREMYCEMEKKVMLGEISKHPFQFSPSSSSTSSSSSPSQYKGVLNARSNSQWPAQFYGDDRMTNFNNIGLVDLQTSSSHGTGDQGNFKAGENVEREHMFNKVVTPSDVGKLNRLVIPKQHAEKYFPLDSTANEKGLLLNFEDRGGKLWRFRYSYWNSSQSYVMTKGWSRFVKEKKLDAGDIVSFERGLGDLAKDRLFIDWKRRLANASAEVAFQLPAFPWGSSILMPPPSVHMSLQQQLNYHRGSYTVGRLGYNEVTQVSPDPVFHLGPAGPQGVLGGDRNEVLPMVFRSVPVVQGNVAAAKRLRLFGVNLECPTTEDADGDVVLSSTISQARVSSLSPQLPSLQLRLFNGAALPAGLEDLPRQGKALSLDLDI